MTFVLPEHGRIISDNVTETVVLSLTSSSNARTQNRTSTGHIPDHGTAQIPGTSSSMVVMMKALILLIHTLLMTEDYGLMDVTAILLSRVSSYTQPTPTSSG